MIDDYPDYFMNMVHKREKVKRLRQEADMLEKEFMSDVKSCLGYFENEPQYDTDGLTIVQTSFNSSPYK